MAPSNPLFSHLRRPLILSPRHLFTTPESAAEARRAVKRRLNMPLPSLSALLQTPPPSPQSPRSKPPPNPNIPRLPEPLSALSPARLNLHNKILSLIRDGDLDEAALLVRHHIYSNCRPAVCTANAVMSALLRAARPADALALHRFLSQAGVAPSITTYNLVLQAYLSSGRIDAALENYRVILKDSPLSPSPTTYRILIENLVEKSRLEEAVQLKNEMAEHCHFSPDPLVYNILMSGFLNSGDPNRVLDLFQELKENLGCEVVKDGVVYGSLLKGYFKKGMEKEAMEWYNVALGEGSNVRFKAESYNSVLDALGKNGKFDVSLGLFDWMMSEHKPPLRITVDVKSFNIMVDGYCDVRRFDEAIMVFAKMGEKNCVPDTFSYNNIIGQLGKNQLVGEAEKLFEEMNTCGINTDEGTYTLLMEACFGVDRVEDAIEYFKKMVELELKPDAVSYNKIIGGLANVGRIDEAKEFYDQMVEREVKMNIASYEILLQAFCAAGRLDDSLKMVRDILMDEEVLLSPELKELVEVALRKGGREEDLGKLFVDVEREKAEALARAAEEKARAEALAREEAARRKAEEAAREEAAARASAAAIEAVLGRRSFWGSKEEEKEESPALGATTAAGGLLNEVNSKMVSVEESKNGNLDAPNASAADGRFLEQARNNDGSGEETKDQVKDVTGEVTTS